MGYRIHLTDSSLHLLVHSQLHIALELLFLQDLFVTISVMKSSFPLDLNDYLSALESDFPFLFTGLTIKWLKLASLCVKFASAICEVYCDGFKANLLTSCLCLLSQVLDDIAYRLWLLTCFQAFWT